LSSSRDLHLEKRFEPQWARASHGAGAHCLANNDDPNRWCALRETSRLKPGVLLELGFDDVTPNNKRISARGSMIMQPTPPLNATPIRCGKKDAQS